MTSLAAAKLVISLLLTMPGTGEMYAVQTWVPADAKEFSSDWATCQRMAKDLEIAGYAGRVPKMTGLKARCDVKPAAGSHAVVNPHADSASLQTVSF